MKPYYRNDGSRLYQGHVLDALRALAAGSVQCVVTSPPYWGLRDYGLPPVEWPAVSYAPMAGLPEIEVPGCEVGCRHEWVSEQRMLHTGSSASEKEKSNGGAFHGDQATNDQWCSLCGGWRGSLGLEPSIEMFVGHIVLVARELWRVLRDDGTFWLNFGDSYSTNPGNGRGGESVDGGKPHRSGQDKTGALPTKNLLGIPWRVALALQADGWWLRSDIVWAKGVSFCSTYSGSCMPESVRDRPTKGHEYVFLLAKSARYYYDQEAVREEATPSTLERDKYARAHPKGWHTDAVPISGGNGQDGAIRESSGRNLRTVWLINPGNFPGSHFATFPPALVEPMIKAGTSERGCCPSCGAPWERVTETDRIKDPTWHTGRAAVGNDDRQDGDWPRMIATTNTTGWIPTCTCPEQEPDPCTVLDPFLGSGTVAEVATRLRRRWVGIELSWTYCDEHIIPRLSEPIQMELAL